MCIRDRLKGYEIGESSRASVGSNIVNLLQLEKGEKVTSMIRVRPEDEGKFVCMVTEQGVIKRTELSAYRNVRKMGLKMCIRDRLSGRAARNFASQGQQRSIVLSLKLAE